jgi:hypothetical protein
MPHQLPDYLDVRTSVIACRQKTIQVAIAAMVAIREFQAQEDVSSWLRFGYAP